MYFVIIFVSYGGQNIRLENFILRVKKNIYDNLSILIQKQKGKIYHLMGLKYRISLSRN